MKHRAEHVGNVIRDAADCALVGGDVRPDATDVDTFNDFTLDETVPIPVVDDALGTVRRAGDNRDFMTLRRPTPAVLVRARRRRIAFGREVVGKKQNAHGAIGKYVFLLGRCRTQEKCHPSTRSNKKELCNAHLLTSLGAI